MSNRQAEMKQIRRLIGNWIGEIRINNYEHYNDINRVGEHLSRQLLNIIYEYELKNLNDVKANFPGLDLGDETKTLVAFQVTSRTDNKKINDSLKKVVERKFDTVFTNGIKFLILDDVYKISFGKKVKKLPSSILPSFDANKDLLYPENLIEKIEEIYEKDADLLKFNKIKLLLEKDIIPFASGKPVLAEDPEIANLKGLLSQAISALDRIEKRELNISRSFFNGNLQVPHLICQATREPVVLGIIDGLNAGNFFWLQGPPSTGKTSFAVLVSKKVAVPSIWIECRDIKAEQLTEHIVQSLTRFLKLDLAPDYVQTLELAFKQVSKNALIILNDIPDIAGKALAIHQLEQFVSIASSAGLQILATSNYRLAENFGDNYDLKVLPSIVPPFDENDTAEVLRFYGASDEDVNFYLALILFESKGHPLLIQSASKYLQQKGWVKDAETVLAIFKGDFGDQADKTIYTQVLEHTTDASARELLYRLTYVVGDFNADTILRVASVKEPLAHTGEILVALRDIWIQSSGENSFQLSPLIKRLKGNISLEVERNIYTTLGGQILEKKNISQIEAYKAIYYFIRGNQFNEAGFVLYKVLIEFTRLPELFFEWAFDSFWYYEQLPQEMAPFLKAVIRVWQIQISLASKKDVAFLAADLKSIIENGNVTPLALGMAYMSMFMVEMVKQPIIALQYLIRAAQNFEQDAIKELGDNLFKGQSFSGIWQIFSQLHTIEEYDQWFSLVQSINTPPDVYDPYSNEMYAMAGVSIYRNAVLKGKNAGTDVVGLLRFLIQKATDQGFLLLAAYAVREIVKYAATEHHDWAAVTKTIEEYSYATEADPLYKFLILSEVGRQYFLDKNNAAAEYYIGEVAHIKVPTFYTEYLDFLIYQLQVTFKKYPKEAANIAFQALETALQGRYLIEDKIKLYGESAIGHTTLANLPKALSDYDAGYTLLLDDFTNSEEQQAIVIRYGNALKYLIYLIQGGKPEDYPSENSVIPDAGYFYRTNDKLLEGGYYFEERKFMVSSGLQSAYEEIGEYDGAKRWAYKSIELSLDLKEGRFIPILEGNIFYLIKDRQFRQAYNVQAYIDSFYTNLYNKIERGEPVDEKLPSLMKGLKLNDLAVYSFILLPVTLLFCQDIITNAVREEQYQVMINDAFASDKYALKDADSFAFTKTLFEKILIERISYAEMLELFETYKGEYRDFIYIMGCLLLSSVTGATEAANLQLANLKVLDKLMRGMRSTYRYLIVPFFDQFWRNKVITHPKEFSQRDHLVTKGFTLIDKTDWPNKVQTIFRILSDHLKIDATQETRDYIGI